MDDELVVRIPRQAIYRGHRVRVLHYEGEGIWHILDGESRRSVHSEQLRFI